MQTRLFSGLDIVSKYRKTDDISYGFRSDHSYISILIKQNTIDRGPGFFKLNTSLLLDKHYTDLIKKTNK